MATSSQVELVERSPSPRPSPPGRGRGHRRSLIIRRSKLQSPSIESGAEATAVQTLRDELVCPSGAKRLDCGAFTAALAWRDNRLSHRIKTTNVSPSPGGKGRGEGGRHTIYSAQRATWSRVKSKTFAFGFLLAVAVGCRDAEVGVRSGQSQDSDTSTSDITTRVFERDRDNDGKPDFRMETFYRGDQEVMRVFSRPKAEGVMTIDSRSFLVDGSMVLTEGDENGDGIFETILARHPETKAFEVFTRKADGTMQPASVRVVEAYKKQMSAVDEFFVEALGKDANPDKFEELMRAAQKKIQDAEKEKKE